MLACYEEWSVKQRHLCRTVASVPSTASVANPDTTDTTRISGVFTRHPAISMPFHRWSTRQHLLSMHQHANNAHFSYRNTANNFIYYIHYIEDNKLSSLWTFGSRRFTILHLRYLFIDIWIKDDFYKQNLIMVLYKDDTLIKFCL